MVGILCFRNQSHVWQKGYHCSGNQSISEYFLTYAMITILILIRCFTANSYDCSEFITGKRRNGVSDGYGSNRFALQKSKSRIFTV